MGAKELHFTVERATRGLPIQNPVSFDFKWTDNGPANAERIDFINQGDSAPNARFNYRYQTDQK